jgi:biopolymer transport protein ExbD
VVTPNSVSNKVAPENDAVMITIDKEGKVYFSVSDNNEDEKQAIIQEINTSQSLV